MKTVNFRDDVVYAVAWKMGMNPRTDLLVDQATAYVSWINHQVRYTYDKHDWPEWTLIEALAPNVNHYIDPDTTPTPIGIPLKVYLADPTTTPAPIDEPFKIHAPGIWVGLNHGTNVWVKFIKRAPQYTFDGWFDSITYKVGDVVYDPILGGCFKAIAEGFNQALPATETDNANWEFVPFPYDICDEVVALVHADALRDDGQYDKATEREKAAEGEDRAPRILAPVNDALTDQMTPTK